MKKILLAVSALLLSLGLGAQPQGGVQKSHQGKSKEEMQKIREEMKSRIQSEHIAYLTSELQLTPEEAEKFWPVFNKAEAEQKETNMVIGEAKKALKAALKDGDENAVNNALDEYMKAREGRKDVHAKYRKEYTKVLGAVKTARFYIAEDGFRTRQLNRLGSGKGPQPGVKFPQGQRPQGNKQ